MQYYIGPEGRGTVEEISTKLKEGCPSYFNESDYKYYLAVECLERAASMTNNPDERDILARDAFNLLTKIPESADLSAICKRFENLRLVTSSDNKYCIWSVKQFNFDHQYLNFYMG